MSIKEIRNKIIDRVCDSLMPTSKYTDKEVEVFVDDLLSKLIQSQAKEIEKNKLAYDKLSSMYDDLQDELKKESQKDLSERNIIIELSDNEYHVVTQCELDGIVKSAEEFDGFLGFILIGKVSELVEENTQLKQKLKESEDRNKELVLVIRNMMRYKSWDVDNQAKQLIEKYKQPIKQ